MKKLMMAAVILAIPVAANAQSVRGWFILSPADAACVPAKAAAAKFGAAEMDSPASAERSLRTSGVFTKLIVHRGDDGAVNWVEVGANYGTGENFMDYYPNAATCQAALALAKSRGSVTDPSELR